MIKITGNLFRDQFSGTKQRNCRYKNGHFPVRRVLNQLDNFKGGKKRTCSRERNGEPNTKIRTRTDHTKQKQETQ